MRGAAVLLAAALAGGASGRAAEPAGGGLQEVRVRPGDTLWGLAREYLKDPAQWGEILKHNRLPTSDPTVALPGMTLRVPVRLIRADRRAAVLVYAVNRVLRRRRDTAAWTASRERTELFQGDALRTLEDSRARVRFLDRELLNLEQNSMAVIKPADLEGDVELRSGSVFAGRARVVTSNARVTPRTADTRYSATVGPDLTTRVEVFAGRAAVDAQGSRVEVPAGMETRVAPGLAPELPRPLADAPALEARAQEFASAATVGGGAAPNPRAEARVPVPEADAETTLRQDIDSLRVGLPILGYHVQASADREFRRIAFDRRYEAEERWSANDTGLAPGAYWWRIAVIDLLGTEGRYGEPKYYTVGVRRSAPGGEVDLARSVLLAAPPEGKEISGDKVQVAGTLRDDGLRVEVAGQPARTDADGNFSASVPLRPGVNEILIEVSDGRGNSTRISRRVTRR